MTKRKLQRFAENDTFPILVQRQISYPPVPDVLKGRWNENFFSIKQPIIVELGCGRGEYTVNLAERHPEKNYIGVDFKGARIWRGAKTAVENKMNNVGFLRIEIQHIELFFSQKEVSEVWITFPDPQLQRSREKKRLTSVEFLDRYRNILTDDGIIHLKTDSKELYDYTLEVINEQKCRLHESTDDLYHSHAGNEILSIQTTYEKMFRDKGARICYLKFSLS